MEVAEVRLRRSSLGWRDLRGPDPSGRGTGMCPCRPRAGPGAASRQFLQSIEVVKRTGKSIDASTQLSAFCRPLSVMESTLETATAVAAVAALAINPSFLADPENAPILDNINAHLRTLCAAITHVQTTPSIAPNISAQAAYNPDMAYPKEGQIFVPRGMSLNKSLDGLLDDMNLWARDHGYAVRILRSKKDPGGKRRRVTVACLREGVPRYRVPEPTDEVIRRREEGGLRKLQKKRSTLKCGCPFIFNLVETMPRTLRFEVRYTHKGMPAYNHEPLDNWCYGLAPD